MEIIKNWHALAIKEVLFLLGASLDGLSEKEAMARLGKIGRNVLPQEKSFNKGRLFLSQFNSPLIYILLVVLLISLGLRHYSDTLFILVVLLINTTVSFYQENKANNSISALRQMVKIRAKVWRDGNEKEINGENLVPGDIVFLQPGDKIPADGRIIESRNLKVNEASLTGEWQPVSKNSAEGEKEKTPLSERSNSVFMGSAVASGEAKFLVVATGLETQMGQIVSLLKATKEKKTPLQKKILSLSKIAGVFVLSAVLVIFLIGYFVKGGSFTEILLASLALAVSAVPAGLLPAITVVLVLGMRRILAQRGLVKKLIANETLGSVTVICTDKTGTLTQGRMQVSHILTSSRELLHENFSGVAQGEKANGVESHILALKIATLANDAFLENPEAELENWIVRGRPTEQALLLAGLQAGLTRKELEKHYHQIDKISFSSDLKYSGSLNRVSETKKSFFIIGAPEIIFAKTAWHDIDGQKEKINEEEREKLLKKMESLADRGLRILACAYREYDLDKSYNKLEELADGMVLVGLIALKDPLRCDAKESIALAGGAGIKTVIVTGDHKLTAQAIAQELGMEIGPKQILEGWEIENISDQELKEKIKNILIFSRVSPKHKLRIVDAFQANGEVVAMIGDGVNDAPALKSADVGVAVGSGTDVAKEVADLILLDDGFHIVVKAIEQGRVIFANIRKLFVYLVADDFSEIFLFFGAMIFGLPLPLLPAQILWINLVEDGFPGVALTTEQEVEGVMSEKPRNPKEPILNKEIKRWLLVVFLITGTFAMLAFTFFWKLHGDLPHARTMVFALMCFDSLLFAFCVRSFKRSIFRRDIFSNRYLLGGAVISLALLFLAIYLPPLQKILGTQNLSSYDWLAILSISLFELFLLEVFKKIIFRKKSA